MHDSFFDAMDPYKPFVHECVHTELHDLLYTYYSLRFIILVIFTFLDTFILLCTLDIYLCPDTYQKECN
jgi:hypothetical protein